MLSIRVHKQQFSLQIYYIRKMKNPVQSKYPVIQFKRNEQFDSSTLNLQNISKIMRNYLQSIQTTPHDIGSLLKKENIKELVEHFAQKVVQIKQKELPTSDSLLNHLSFYNQINTQQEEKISKLNDELMTYWKTLAQREQEISTNQAQIFKLKLALEQKQQNILQLMIKNKKLAKNEQQPKIVNNKNEKNPIKINVKQPVQKEPQSLQSTIQYQLRTQKIQQNASQWGQQRRNLLKVIKQKDLKIYHLIQQLHSLKQNK